MKKMKLAPGLVLLLALILVTVAGCTSNGGSAISDNEEFTYSSGIDDNGYWIQVNALQCVTLCDYKAISVPSSIHAISDDALQEEIDALLTGYATEEQVTDRAIVDGDTVNIDYVGTVDGVEFEGGSTEGEGAEVTIGVTTYIDDFLEQLIGHTPGESFDIEVTFPEDYGEDSLNGKDAVFAITVNYIVESITPELTDQFVTENLSADYGWNTVTELNDGIYSELQDSAVMSYMQDYVVDNSTVNSMPETVMDYQEKSTLMWYQDYADQYEMDLDEFLSTYVGVDDSAALLEESKADNEASAQFYLILQAIAEDAGLTATDADVTVFFTDYMGTDDYSDYEEIYGMPYLKLVVLNQKVIDYLVDNAVLE